MNKIPITLGYSVIFIIALYTVLKFLKLPGPYVLMLVAGALMAVYFPLLFLKRLKDKTGEQARLVHKFGAFFLGLVIVSVILRFQHWSIVRFEPNEIIRLVTLSPWIYIVTYCSISFIFIPWLLFDHYKHNKEGILKKMCWWLRIIPYTSQPDRCGLPLTFLGRNSCNRSYSFNSNLSALAYPNGKRFI